jgi:hypothetical protein
MHLNMPLNMLDGIVVTIIRIVSAAGAGAGADSGVGAGAMASGFVVVVIPLRQLFEIRGNSSHAVHFAHVCGAGNCSGSTTASMQLSFDFSAKLLKDFKAVCGPHALLCGSSDGVRCTYSGCGGV